ncbi:hypothetical protein FE257_009260 [Aspergillus nanangensis]|uniref:Uncharacterized protein n=1 Tax=Aspergillus nanangensis TaxID=2582783 RepID=A0AAD4CKC9_ASPNN|nr:hypothetical protein FE257_009260 [Aspergillus nanangensis]
MIPPCDLAILENNPQFKRLYQQLTTTRLNPDGSTRANDAQPERKAVLEELKNCRIHSAKKQIKQQTLRHLAFDPASGLPDDYRDPVAIITLYLASSPSQIDINDDARDGIDTLSLLGPDIDAFCANLPTLMDPFSNLLSSSIHDLRLIADAGTTTNAMQSTEQRRFRHRGRPSIIKAQVPLSSQITERLQKLRQIQLSDLPNARTQMAATAAEVLSMRAALLERTIMLLERTKHGALARATKAKAEHLAMVSQGVEGKLSVMKLDVSATIHTPEATAALNTYRKHLIATRGRLDEQRIQAQQELEAYADADSGASGSSRLGPVREIARRYGSLIQEIEDVKKEIQRLDG